MSTSALFGGRSSILFKAFNVTFLGVPGWLDRKFGPKDIEGPRLGDLSVQTSSYGVEIGRVHGTVAISGNLMWLENNKLKETVHKKKLGGKGGAATAEPNITFTYSATFAIGICEGPIDGLARIWCGDKLIYNAGSGDVSTIIASNKSAKGMRIHLGTDDQLPDSRYEASRGVGETPSFRGLAYVVFDDFQLADYGNTLQAANFKFEVVQVANTESVRRIVGGQTGVQFGTGSMPGPKPYIYYADGVVFVAGSDMQGYAFSTDCKFISYTKPEKFLEPQSGYFSASGFMDGEQVNVNREYMSTPGDPYIVISPSKYQQNLPSDHYLWGLVLSEDGLSCMAVTGTTSPYGHGFGGTHYWVMDTSGEVIDSGLLDFECSIQTFSIGRQSVAYSTSCMENEGGYIWTAYGAGAGQVCLYRIQGGILSLVKQIDGQLTDSVFSQPSILAKEGVAYIVAGDGMDIFSRLEQVIKAPPLLSEVISSEVLTSDLISDDDIDVSGLTQTVHGYAVQGGSIRSAVEPLQTAFRFDVIQSGYKARFIPRGRISALSIPFASLIASESGSASEALVEDREMDTQLPVKTTVSYLDADREYSVSNQPFERLTTRAVGKQDIDLPIVMTATEAAQTAEILTLLPWLERSTFSFKLPPIYQPIEPTDVITIVAPWASLEMRLSKIDYGTDGTLDCTATPNKASLYSSVAVAVDPPAPNETIGVPGPSMFVPLDIPLISEAQQSSPGFIGAMVGFSEAWTGAMLVQTDDNGQTWKNLQGFSGMSTLGITENYLPASTSTLIDQRVLIVRLIAGELESVTRDQMLSGVHYVAYGADGRWEIVRFQNADLQEDGSFAVSGFVRGEKGTEWATGLHQVNDYFVLLDDPDNISIDLSLESLLTPKVYRGVTLGADIDSAADVEFTYRGVNLEPLSPVYPRATRASDGALTLTVQRRSRLPSSWWANGMDAPVGETSRALEADVISGAVVKRTLTSSSGLFGYSAAEQIADFGSIQASLTLRIYQISSVVGRGYPIEVSL